LAADERLEVIVDNRLCQSRELSATPRMKEDRVPAKALGLAGDTGLGAMERAGELSMAGARGKT